MIHHTFPFSCNPPSPLPLASILYDSLPLSNVSQQYLSLLLSTPLFHSLPLSTPLFHSIPLSFTLYHSLPLSITLYYSVPLSTHLSTTLLSSIGGRKGTHDRVIWSSMTSHFCKVHTQNRVNRLKNNEELVAN